MKIIVAVVLVPRYIVNKTGHSALDDTPFDKFDDDISHPWKFFGGFCYYIISICES